MSGMTRSMPNISSSGNMRPQSMTTISSPYSKTYMFLPISPTPPSGMMRSGVSASRRGARVVMGSPEERQLVDGSGRRPARAATRRFAGRRGPGGVGGVGRGRRTVSARRGGTRVRTRGIARGRVGTPAMSSKLVSLDRRRPQRRRRVVHREDEGVAGAGRRVGRRTVPWAWLIRAPGMNRAIEWRPRVTTSAGSSTSSWRRRYGAQAAISSGSGSRLSGGRHFTTFVMKTSSRRQPIEREQLDEQVARARRRTAGPGGPR